MKKVLSILVLVVSFLMVNSFANAQCDGSKSKTSKVDCKSESSKIALVKFHSDYCGACKNLEPKINELKGKLDKSVVFVKFDFTSDDSKAKTRTLADNQGLSTLLESNSGTGYILVYDLKTKKVLAKLNNSLSITDMEKTIKNYL